MLDVNTTAGKFTAITVEAQQENWIKRNNLSQVLYYERGSARGMTVCLLHRNGSAISRGVAMSNPVDSFNRISGRILARGRAIRAARKCKSSGMIGRFDYPAGPDLELVLVFKEFACKSSWCPSLTDYEMELLDKSKVLVGSSKQCCCWQVKCTDNEETWVCTAHLHESRVFTCQYTGDDICSIDGKEYMTDGVTKCQDWSRET